MYSDILIFSDSYKRWENKLKRTLSNQIHNTLSQRNPRPKTHAHHHRKNSIVGHLHFPDSSFSDQGPPPPSLSFSQTQATRLSGAITGNASVPVPVTRQCRWTPVTRTQGCACGSCGIAREEGGTRRPTRRSMAAWAAAKASMGNAPWGRAAAATGLVGWGHTPLSVRHGLVAWREGKFSLKLHNTLSAF